MVGDHPPWTPAKNSAQRAAAFWGVVVGTRLESLIATGGAPFCPLRTWRSQNASLLWAAAAWAASFSTEAT
eukprot:12231083-Alexandrium_andersonii.AAC.1